MQFSRACCSELVDCITPLISLSSDPPTCQTRTQVLYTVALNTSVVLGCEMAAHPGDLMTFSWSGNTSLISRHLDTMATSRTQSDTSALWIVRSPSLSKLGFRAISRAQGSSQRVTRCFKLSLSPISP